MTIRLIKNRYSYGEMYGKFLFPNVDADLAR